MTRIVPAQKTDLPQLVEIYNQAIEQHCTADTSPFTVEQRKDWFAEHTSKEYPLLVAKDGDSVLGYLTLSPYRFGRKALSNTLEISYFVHFEHHRKGVASKLIDNALSLCYTLQVKTLVAILIDSNQGSIGILNKYHFQEWGRLPDIVEFDNGTFDHLYYGLHLNKTSEITKTS